MAAILAEIFGWVGQFIAMILGVLIMVVTWFIQFALTLNDSVTTMPTVTRGMDITLSLTNLGFITIFIVIAISTILRRENYGIKKLLSKLIIAALLVNFSLPIAGGILHIADSFTVFFINNSVPHFTPNGTGLVDFGAAIGKAFAPQAIGTVMFTPSTSTASNAVNALAGAGNSLLISLTLPFFAVFYALTILIVLIALFVMLMIRFVYLIILLILMPLAWICWITPLTQDLWQKWWKDFLHWTLFAPIMMMFLYITFQTMNQLATTTMTVPSDAAAKAAVGNPNIISVLGQEIALLAVTIGGLIAANSMGIKGAGAALKTAKGVGKGLANWTGKKAARAITSPLRGAGGQKMITSMMGNRLTAPLGRIAANLAQTSGGKAAVDEWDKKNANLSSEQSRTRFDSVKGWTAEKISLAKKLDDEKMITDKDRVDMMRNKNEFSRNGNAAFLNKNIAPKTWADDKTLPDYDKLQAAKATGDPGTIAVAQSAFNQAVNDKTSKMDDEEQKAMFKSLNNSLSNYDVNNPKMAGESKQGHDAVQEALSFAISNNPATYNSVMAKLGNGKSAADVTDKVWLHKVDQLVKGGKLDAIKNKDEIDDFINNAILRKGKASDNDTAYVKLLNKLDTLGERPFLNNLIKNAPMGQVYANGHAGSIVALGKQSAGKTVVIGKSSGSSSGGRSGGFPSAPPLKSPSGRPSSSGGSPVTYKPTP